MCYSDIDITSFCEDLYGDPSYDMDLYVMDLQIISCELDLLRYVNPKTSAYINIIRKIY